MCDSIFDDIDARAQPSSMYDRWKHSVDYARFKQTTQHWPQDMRDRVIFISGILAKAGVLDLDETPEVIEVAAAGRGK